MEQGKSPFTWVTVLISSALSNWFERGEEGEVIPPPVQAPVVFEQVEEEPLEVDLGLVPGVYTKKENQLLPLKAIQAKVVILGNVADVELTQRFCNQQDTAIEAV